MSHNITNCIQNTWTESGDMVIFWYKYANPFQIHLLFRYFQVFIHQNRTHPDTE